MAPNMDYIAAALATWLSDALDLEIRFVGGDDWRQRERSFRAGEIDLVWICGLPYVWMADDPADEIELLAAPVMAGQRYQDRPIYFSDVVVKRGSGIRDFCGLRGKRWSYNEPGSHSGYNLVRATLASRGENWSYFGEVIEAGSHQRSLELIQGGQVEGSAIDSTVLEEAIRRDPALAREIRVIDVLGPSPIPPLVIRSSVDSGVRRRLRRALTAMGESERGRRQLRELRLRRMALVEDEDYDAVRRMERQAAVVDRP